MSNGRLMSEEEKMVSESLNDLLLFTTMCFVGFPVDAQLKDGSVFSGIFYTACLDHDYAIVLKTARMMKKGDHKTNVPNCSLIDTLIIQAEDLVQVVAKDISLPAEGILGKSLAGDTCGSTTETSCNNCTSLPFLNGERMATEGTLNDFSSQLKSPGAKESDEVLASRSSDDPFGSLPNSPESNNEGTEADKFPGLSFENSDVVNTKDSKPKRPLSDYSTHPDVLSSVFSAPASEFHPTSSTITKSMSPKASKESKLNPKAKLFSPSAALRRPSTPTLAALYTRTYVPDSLHGVPTVSAEPEKVTGSFAYVSAKYLPHSNLVYETGHNDQQYNQPILAYAGGRTQPVRYAAQYGHLQPGIAYMHENSQNGTAKRLVHCIYVHPISNVTIPGYNPTTQTLDPDHPIIVGTFPVSGGSLFAKSV